MFFLSHPPVQSTGTPTLSNVNVDRFPIYKMRTCEPQIVTSNPTPLIVQLKSQWWLSFRCFTSWLCPLMGRLDLVLKRRMDSTQNRQKMEDSDREGMNVYWLKCQCLSWRLDFEKLNAWYIRPWRYPGFVLLGYQLCFLYSFMR